MPFDGSGNYTASPAPNFPAVGGAVISSTYYNAVINDIVTAFNLCLTRDGQGKPSANIDWNAKNLTNVATFAATTASFTTALGVASGGTGTTATPTNGQVHIGNGTNFSLATLTAGAGISITNGSGSISIAAVGGGSVSSVDVAGGTTGLTFSGGPITTAGTITMAGTLALANGGTGSTTAAGARTNLAAAGSGAITASGLTIATIRLAGRTTAGTGALEEISAGVTLSLTAGTLSVASVPNVVTFNNAGAGAVSGTTFDGAAARTISYNTVGALPEVPRVQSVTSAATVTPTASNDEVVITAQAEALTLANPSGSPSQGQALVIRIKDNGTARAIAYGTQYRAIGITNPTTTVANKTLYLGLIYNSTDTKWDVLAVAQEA